MLGVAFAGGGVPRNHALDGGQVLRGQLHLQGAQGLLQARRPSCPYQRNHIFAPRQHPGDGDLGDGGVLLAGHCPQRFHQLQVVFQIAFLEARTEAAEIVLGQVAIARPVTADQPAGQHAVGSDPDSQFPGGG